MRHFLYRFYWHIKVKFDPQVKEWGTFCQFVNLNDEVCRVSWSQRLPCLPLHSIKDSFFRLNSQRMQWRQADTNGSRSSLLSWEKMPFEASVISFKPYDILIFFWNQFFLLIWALLIFETKSIKTKMQYSCVCACVCESKSCRYIVGSYWQTLIYKLTDTNTHICMWINAYI